MRDLDQVTRPTTMTTVPSEFHRPVWCAECHRRVPPTGGFRVIEHHTALCSVACRESYVERHIQPQDAASHEAH